MKKDNCSFDKDTDFQKIKTVFLADVEENLNRVTSNKDARIEEVQQYLNSAGGKRIRPTLVLLGALCGECADFFRAENVKNRFRNERYKQLVDIAASVELLHLGSLYHDDVMDESPMRRNKKTAHTVWGNAVAIITGDILFAISGRLVRSMSDEIRAVHADAFTDLCRGQMRETMGKFDGESLTDFYFDTISGKTEALITCSLMMGALCFNADEKTSEILKKLGFCIGIGYQIRDDLLDIVGYSADSGKLAGRDLVEGVKSFPQVVLYNRVENAGEDSAGAGSAVEDFAGADSAGESSTVGAADSSSEGYIDESPVDEYESKLYDLIEHGCMKDDEVLAEALELFKKTHSFEIAENKLCEYIDKAERYVEALDSGDGTYKGEVHKIAKREIKTFLSRLRTVDK